MLEKIIFERENKGEYGILDSKSLVKHLATSFYEQFSPLCNTEIFVRVGSLLEPLKFEVRASYNPFPVIGNTMCELDEPELIANILRIAKRRRVIGDDIYENTGKALYNFDLNGGVYLVVNDGIPVVRITDTPQENCTYIYRPVSFESVNKTESGSCRYGSEILKHIPDLESTHRFYRVELEFFIDELGVICNNFLTLYERMKEYYQKSGFTTVESGFTTVDPKVK